LALFSDQHPAHCPVNQVYGEYIFRNPLPFWIMEVAGVRSQDRSDVYRVTLRPRRKVQVTVNNQRRHRGAVLALRWGIRPSPPIRVIDNKAASEPCMVFQGKPIEHRDNWCAGRYRNIRRDDRSGERLVP